MPHRPPSFDFGVSGIVWRGNYYLLPRTNVKRFAACIARMRFPKNAPDQIESEGDVTAANVQSDDGSKNPKGINCIH